MEMSRHILTKIDFLSLTKDDNCSKLIIIDTYIIITKIILITYGIIDTYIDHCKLFSYTNSGMLWFLYGSKCWGFAPGAFQRKGICKDVGL